MKRSRQDEIVRELAHEIIGGRRREGSLLPSDAELMARFGVSRTVLRETLKTLAAKGLIQPKTRVGTRVVERTNWNLLDPDMLRWHLDCGIGLELLAHLSDVRLALEPVAASLAAQRRSMTDIGTLDAIVGRMEAPEASPEAFAAADLDFHLAVARLSGNPFFRTASALIEVALAATFAITTPVNDPTAKALSCAAHRRVVTAIAAGDGEAAAAAIVETIRAGAARVAAAAGR
ncbi:Transcriptional regulator, GntR family [uncultured Pleomorphomonas sp.]|uniref:Transcriptional regulator, GntR family n=1 Tax=uncultured Pleomorphomonas sp. TaxID=442121 RepID=A0A212LHM3_9HYPH|nr:Transcriptional regulator, GntR family [uncultured Pleomorphomonas sp.]